LKIKLAKGLFLAVFINSAHAQDLVETFQLAIQNDPQLKQAYYTQYSVGESKAQSIANLLPTISVSGKSSRDRIDNKKANYQSSGTQNYWNHGFSVTFSQPVFHWEHWVQLDQSSNRIAKAEADYQAELQNLIVKTAEAYFNILAAQDNVEFAQSELDAIKKQLEQAQQRFDVGLIAITDVYEAQAGYDQATADKIDAENTLDDSKEALIEIIGETDLDLMKLSKTINLSSPAPNNISEWAKNAETNNLQIIAALNQAEISRKDISLQQSGHLPTIDIIASYGVQDVNSTFGSRGDNQSVGLQLNIPIFQGGLISSRSKQARYDYIVAKESLLSIKRQVKRQLRNAFRDINSSINRVHALKAAVASAESSLEATLAGSEVGTRTMVDVLAEQRNLYRAKRDYSRTRYDYFINGIKLKQAASSLSEQDLELINQYLEK
jgi:outer membrane protein